jgi:hypothetical protein
LSIIGADETPGIGASGEIDSGGYSLDSGSHNL